MPGSFDFLSLIVGSGIGFIVKIFWDLNASSLLRKKQKQNLIDELRQIKSNLEKASWIEIDTKSLDKIKESEYYVLLPEKEKAIFREIYSLITKFNFLNEYRNENIEYELNAPLGGIHRKMMIFEGNEDFPDEIVDVIAQKRIDIINKITEFLLIQL